MLKSAMNTYWALLAQPLVSDDASSKPSSPAPSTSKLPRRSIDHEPTEVELNTVPSAQRPGMLVRATSSFVKMVTGVRNSERENGNGERDGFVQKPPAALKKGQAAGIQEEQEPREGQARPGLTQSGSSYGTFA